MEESFVKKKVNLLGDQGVGKTSLILRYVKNVFGEEYLKTIGTNVYTKDVSFEDGKVKLVIQDIMGETGFEAVQAGAFKGSTGAIAVADIMRTKSLHSLLDNWIPRYKRASSKENPIILAVNKFDLKDKKITAEELEEIYNKFDHVIFTSAKTGRNVEYMFKEMASKVAYNIQLSYRDIDEILAESEVTSPKELLDSLFTVCSNVGGMPYDIREGLLEESGINKFDLDEEIFSIEEKNVLDFANLLMYWYEEREEEYARDLVEKVLDKYQ